MMRSEDSRNVSQWLCTVAARFVLRAVVLGAVAGSSTGVRPLILEFVPLRLEGYSYYTSGPTSNVNKLEYFTLCGWAP